MENKPRYKLVKRKPNNNNNTPNQNETKRSFEQSEPNPMINIPELITSIKRSLYSDIDARAKYWMEQRIGLLLNNNALMKRNTTELKIDYDNNSGGLSWLFKYNGSTVAYIDSRGVLYCSNILLNGVNLLNAINNIIGINNTLNNLSDKFVRHIDLKNGTYNMDINSSVMKYLKVKYDDNNELDFLHDDFTAMAMNTDRTVGYAMFRPNLSNGNVIYGLRFGKDDNTGAQLRYTYSTTAKDSYVSLGPIGVATTLAVYRDKRVVIDTTNNLSQALLCKYNGNLGNSNYLRIGCGDNRDTGIFAYGRESNSNYIYLKLQGRACELRIYDAYMNLSGSGPHYIRTSRTSGAITYFLEASLANNSTCAIVIGQATSQNRSSTLTYRRATTPLVGLGFYNNDELLTLDPSGNCNITGSLTAASITSNGAISGTDIYASNGLTVDGPVLITQLDIANTTKNTWYAKLRCEDNLANNDYLRMIFKDLTKQGYIDFSRDTQYYKLKLYIDGSPGMLTVNETGLEFDGQVDCHNDCYFWQNVYLDNIYPSTGDVVAINAEQLIVESPYKDMVFFHNSTTNGAEIALSDSNCDTHLTLDYDSFNHTYSTNLRHNMTTKVTLTDTDITLSRDTTIDGSLTLDSQTINNICTTSDYSGGAKIGDDALITSQAVYDAISESTSKHTYQEIPNNPYTSVGITSNPYLQWSMCKIGSYDTNTDAVCFSEELHQFVIVSNGGAYFSYDGFTWAGNTLSSFTWTGVTYGPTHGYIACTSSNMFIIQSDDGRTWVPHNNVSPSTGSAIAYGNGYYVIVDEGSNASYLSYNTDPTVSTGWGSFWLGSSRRWYNIAYSKPQHKFIVVGASGYYVTFDDYFSSSSRVTGQLSGVTADCHSVCYSDKLNLWIIACNNHGYCYVSSDGVTFSPYSLPYSDYWHRVVWGGDRFVMTCNSSYKAAYSLDGTSWYPFQVSDSPYTTWLGLAYGNGVFVLSGSNKLVSTYTSPNSYIAPRAMFQAIYPVGSIYMSIQSINPGLMFGGTWVEIQNRFLYCVPSSSSSLITGGNATHTISMNELPYRWWQFNSMNDKGAQNVTLTDYITNGSCSGPPVYYGVHYSYTGWDYGNPNGPDAFSTLPPYITVHCWYRTA